MTENLHQTIDKPKTKWELRAERLQAALGNCWTVLKAPDQNDRMDCYYRVRTGLIYELELRVSFSLLEDDLFDLPQEDFESRIRTRNVEAYWISKASHGFVKLEPNPD